MTYLLQVDLCGCVKVTGIEHESEATRKGSIPDSLSKTCDFKSCCMGIKSNTFFIKQLWQILSNLCLFVNSALSTTHQDVSVKSCRFSLIANMPIL